MAPSRQPVATGGKFPPPIRTSGHALLAQRGHSEDDQLLQNAPELDGIPGVLIHGRYDVSSPLETAWRLSQGGRQAGFT